MKKIPLYIDCDGVILDTMAAAKRIAKRLGYNPDDFNSLHEYFISKVNWKQIIEEGGVIGNAKDVINQLALSEKYDVTILTKFSMEKLSSYKLTYGDPTTEEFDVDDSLVDLSSLKELEKNEASEFYKLFVLKQMFPNIPVIFTDVFHNKDNIVEPKGAILIEDNLRNFRSWREKGGTAVLLSVGGIENYVYDYIEDKKNNPITSHEAKCAITKLEDFETTRTVKKLVKRYGEVA